MKKYSVCYNAFYMLNIYCLTDQITFTLSKLSKYINKVAGTDTSLATLKKKVYTTLCNVLI